MKILTCVMFGAATVLGAARASADVIHVPGDQPGIQAAIDAAQPGDSVLVAPGTYHEAITIPNKADFTVESSDGAAVTIIDGDGAAAVVSFVNVPSSVRFAGFTVRNGVIGLHGPSVVNAIAIDDCVVRDCTGVAALDMAATASSSSAASTAAAASPSTRAR